MKYEITEKKAAEILGISESRVSQLVKGKLLDAVTINGRVRISRESAERYRSEARKTGRPPKTSYATVSQYTLMNASHEVASVLFDSAADEPLSVSEVIDPTYAPIGVLTRGGNPKRRVLNSWWLHRSVPRTRPGIESKLAQSGLNTPSNLAIKSMGLSLSDCYWLRPNDAPTLTWEKVNFYDNDFIDSNIDDWDDWLSGIGLSSPDNTSEGELPKKWVIGTNGTRYLLKGCRSDDQRPYNEAVATALYRRLLDPCDYVPYDIVDTAQGAAAKCPNFLGRSEEFITADQAREATSSSRGNSVYDRFCRDASLLGVNETELRTHMSKMIVCDTILANSDRHWRNFGFIRNLDTMAIRPAPLFDSGNSLWFAKTEREVATGDRAFLARPFAYNASEQLACVDDVSWFSPCALRGFADEACDILSASSHAKPRLDFIHEGIEQNIKLVEGACELLSGRIARGK